MSKIDKEYAALNSSMGPNDKTGLCFQVSIQMKLMDGLMTHDLHPFNNISVISGQWEFDNERHCAMEPYLPLKTENIPT